MPATSVKFIHSGMTGAPTLTGQVGSLIAVLDACLVNGFGLKSLDSLVVASNVATMNISTGHSFEVGSVALVAGAAPAGLNGQWRITAVTTNTASFATSGIADQTATGSITAKLASSGWGKPFSGTNQAAYRSADVTGNRHFLRVNDNWTTDPRLSRLIGYETMSAISTGAGLFPTTALANGGAWLAKSGSADADARPWVFFGDEKLFYFGAREGTEDFRIYAFGEPIGYKTPDPYNTVLVAHYQDVLSVEGSTNSNLGTTRGGNSPSTYTSEDSIVARSVTGLGTARSVGRYAAHMSNGDTSGRIGDRKYPNAGDNALIFSELLMVCEKSYRAKFPGVNLVPQDCRYVFSSLDMVVGNGALAGKTFVAVEVNPDGGVVFFDRDGPWR